MTKFKARRTNARPRKLEDMKLVRGGTFQIGSADFHEDEKPVRTATLAISGAWIGGVYGGNRGDRYDNPPDGT